MKDYNHSFHRAIRARPVDVIPLNSVRVWKIKSKDWFKIKEYVPLLKKADHITVFITKEIWESLSSDDHEWNLLNSWNCGKGVGTYPCCLIDYGHEVMGGDVLPWRISKSESQWGQNLQNWQNHCCESENNKQQPKSRSRRNWSLSQGKNKDGRWQFLPYASQQSRHQNFSHKTSLTSP